MHFSSIFTFSTLALCALAADKGPFKIGVTFPGRNTLYLTETGVGTPDIANAMQCSLSEGDKGSISCGNQKQGLGFNEWHPFEGALKPSGSPTNNKDWSVGLDGAISWSIPNTQKYIAFSIKASGTDNRIFAEVCSVLEHRDKTDFTPGQPKAYWVK